METGSPEIMLTAPYRPRAVRPLGVWNQNGWRLRVHGIGKDREIPRPPVVEATEQLARVVLPQPPVTKHRYGVGFVGVHDAGSGCYAFVDWWADHNELHHRAFVGPGDRPEAMKPVTGEGSTACVWDLAVIAFEREAWVEAVLDNPSGPDPDRYVAAELHADV